MKRSEGKYRDLRLFFALAVFAVAMTLGQGAAAQGPTPDADAVSSGCEIDYPPFCIVHEGGRADGFSVELMRAAMQKMGREVTFRTGPWADVRGWLERGEVDALPLVGRTPEREELFDFTVPYLTMSGAIVVRQETDDVRSLADLRGRRVGVMQGDNAEEFLRREERGFEIVTAPTFADSFRDLAEGRCDAVVIQRLVAIRLLEETGLTNLKIVERPIREFAQDFCFAVKEGDRETLSLLNEGLALAVADGTHRRLHAKWFAQLELPADRPIVVGGDHNYPPIEFLDEKGRPAGFTVELTRAIAREMNMDVRIELGPWGDRVNALRDGKIDALEGMFYSVERDRVLDFSPRYLVLHYVSVVRKGDGPPPRTLEELRGRDLVVQSEDAILDALAERGIDARITTVETQEDVVRAVAEGRNACGLALRFGALHATEQHKWTNIDVGDRAIYSGEYGYAVQHGNEALLAQFTEGLQVVKNSGEYRRLHEKWMGVYEEHVHWSDVLKMVALVAGPVLLLAVLALLWSWSLKRQVRSRTRELRESLDHFQSVFEAANTGTSIARPTGEMNVNQAFAEMLGYTREELQDRTWQELTPPEDVPETELRIKSLLDGQEDYARFEKRYVRKDGGTVWADVSVALLRDSHGRPLRFITTVVDITERKQAEEALRESEARYRFLVDNSCDLIWRLNPDGVFSYVSPSWMTLLGYEPSFVEGKAFQLFVHPDDVVECECYISRVSEARKTLPGPQYRVKNADGTWQWHEGNITPVLGVNGACQYFVGVSRDITERKRAAEALQSSETRYRRLFESAKDGILILDAETGRVVDVNPYLTQLLGYDRNALLGEPLWEIGPFRDVAASREAFRVLQEKEYVRYENLPLETATGGLVDVEFVSNVYLVNHAKVIQCNIRDITERVTAEETRIRQQRSIELSNRIANVFLTASGDEIFSNVLDIILPALDSRFGFFGYIDEAGDLVCPSLTRDVWEQCQDAGMGVVFPRAGWGGLWGRSLIEKQTMVTNENLRFPEGHVTLENALAVPIVHHENLIGQFVAANKAGGYGKDDRDLLEIAAAQTAPILFAIQEKARQEAVHMKLQEQFNQAQKMESVGRLAGGVAHDFNNMLNVILGHAELMLNELSEDNPLRDGLEEIRKAGERSANLTRQLLAFARKQTVAPKAIDLNETIASMLKMLERLIGEDIDLLWKPGKRLDLVHIDPGQVDQILANLTVNARDAIGHANGEVTIETANVCFDEEYCTAHAGFLPGDYVLLAVSDDGCGMDEETRAQIFEPFFTTKSTGEGTGLGLATVYGIVKQNNGFVNVYSEPGKGTTFRIYLPALDADSKRHEGALTSDAPAVGGNETILIVEDEAAILKLTRKMLERLGYTVLTAGTPSEALRMAREQQGRIDLLITDVVMPEMNGREMARIIQECCPNIRSLFMSGHTAHVIAHQGVLDDGVNFIQKPFSPRDLARKVREVLDS